MKTDVRKIRDAQIIRSYRQYETVATKKEGAAYLTAVKHGIGRSTVWRILKKAKIMAFRKRHKWNGPVIFKRIGNKLVVGISPTQFAKHIVDWGLRKGMLGA